MTVPIISHSHEGIRVNIDGVTDFFGNAVQVAEAYARHKATCRELADVIAPLAGELGKAADWIRGLPTEEHGALVLSEDKAVRLQDGITGQVEALNLVLSKLMEHCRR